MIEVDDSKLTADDRDYVERWAKVLDVSVPELLGRILLAGIEGEIYVEKPRRNESLTPRRSGGEGS